MPHTISLTLPDLNIDVENPRLAEPNQSQRDALRALAKHQQRKLIALARDILENGLNPSELLIVVPADGDKKRYVVLEGNRRVAAAKALENPELLVGALDGPALAELRKLSKKYQESPIESVPCVVVNDRSEAEHWITLRHTGENDGAGLVRWGGGETSRFRARSGEVDIHDQALNFLEERGELTAEARRQVPVTTFKRLLGTPEVRERLGLDLTNGELRAVGQQDKVAKALLHVIADLTGPKAKKVHDFYTKEKRVAYAESLPTRVVVKAKGNSSQSVARTTTRSSTKPSQSGRVVRAKPRDILIPRDCTLKITDPRLQEIESELRSLSLTSYANAVSVLFRVFLELSVDAYIAAKGLPSNPKSDTLASKLTRVAGDLQAKQKLTAQQAVPVKRACGRDMFFAASVMMMHQYVHNQHVFPAAGDLRVGWDNLQPFITAIWPA